MEEEQMEVRDMRGGDWFWAPNAILTNQKSSGTAKLVYMALAMHANRFQAAWPTVKTIAEICAISERSVQYGRNMLIAERLIRVIHVPNKASKYILLRIEEGRGANFAPGATTASRGAKNDNHSSGVGVKPQQDEQYEQNKEQEDFPKNQEKIEAALDGVWQTIGSKPKSKRV